MQTTTPNRCHVLLLLQGHRIKLCFVFLSSRPGSDPTHCPPNSSHMDAWSRPYGAVVWLGLGEIVVWVKMSLLVNFKQSVTTGLLGESPISDPPFGLSLWLLFIYTKPTKGCHAFIYLLVYLTGQMLPKVFKVDAMHPGLQPQTGQSVEHPWEWDQADGSNVSQRLMNRKN